MRSHTGVALSEVAETSSALACSSSGSSLCYSGIGQLYSECSCCYEAHPSQHEAYDDYDVCCHCCSGTTYYDYFSGPCCHYLEGKDEANARIEGCHHHS